MNVLLDAIWMENVCFFMFTKGIVPFIVVEQGCGNCTDVDCKSCKINFCNAKEIGVKHCWTTNGSTCSTGYYDNCFTERTETNECKITK